MNNTKNSIVLLKSTTHAVKACREIQKQGVLCKLIPVPRDISSLCGVCVSFNTSEEKIVLETLLTSKVEIDKIIKLNKK